MFSIWPKISLMSMVMGRMNKMLSIFLLLAYILSDFPMVTVDCLGHYDSHWEVCKFIFSSSD